MDLITQFALGDDIAVLLLVLGVAALAAIALGVLIPPRLARRGAALARRRAETGGARRRAKGADGADGSHAAELDEIEDEDEAELAEVTDTGDAELDAHLGSRLGGLVTTATTIAASVGVPMMLLLALVPGSTDVRILRVGFVLVGLVAGALAAWRAGSMLLGGLAIAPADRARSLPRFGGLFVASAFGIAALPIVPAVYFMREAAASPMIAYAAGAALFALVLHAVAGLAGSVGTSSALLAGADEKGLPLEGEENPGAAHLQLAQLLRRGPARAAALVALTATLVAASIRVGVPVFGAEGILVPLFVLVVAILIALLVAVIPPIGRADRERTSLRIGALVPALLAVGTAAAAISLWLPSAYQSLRFAAVGMDSFTDPALTGGSDPVPRANLEPQILQSIGDMTQWIDVTDESRYASAFLDLLTLYGIHPNAVVAAALALGALAALAAQLLAARVLNPAGGSALRAARTHRTGGVLGIAASGGSALLAAAGGLGALSAVLLVLSVIGRGVPELMLALLAFAGLGALLVIAASAAFHTSELLADRPGTDAAVRAAGSGGAAETAVSLQLALAMAALPLILPMIGAMQAAGRAGTVWEDRALHALTPSALPVAGGIALALVATALVAAGMLTAQRRLGAASVVETRAALLAGESAVDFSDLPAAAKRAALAPVATAALMPIVAGFGLGPSALPAFVVTLLGAGAVLAVGSTVFAGSSRAALEVIESGRYGGRGSWAHSGALGAAALGDALRGALGTMIALAAVLGALISVLTASPMVNAMLDGTEPALRWGAAILALLVAGGCWLYALTAPEPDLEDDLGEESAPLFSRRAEEAPAGALLEDWADDEGDDEGAAPRGRGGRGGRAGREKRTRR